MKSNPLVFAWLFFVLVVLARPSLYGVDPYFFVSISCGHNVAASHESWLAQNFSFFPCDWMTYKLAIVALGTLFFAFIYLVGRVLDKERASHYAALFLLNPVLVQMLFNFEDDLFGLPFLGLALFLFVWWIKEGSWQRYVAILAVVGIGYIFWQGIAFFGLLVLLFTPMIYLVGLVLLVFFAKNIITSYNPMVGEHGNLLIGLASQLLFYGSALLRLQPPYWIPIGLAGLLAFFSLKYSLWLGIFLCIAFAGFAKEKELFTKTRQLNIFVWVVPMLFMLPILIGPPSADNLRFSENVAKLSNGEEIANEYSFGHWILAFGGNALKTGGPPNPDFNAFNGWIVTSEWQSCPILDRTDFLGRGVFYLYDCHERD